MHQEAYIRHSESFQILLLDNLYSLSGSERIYFHGGTAIRWIYGGTRFSEDLDFVTELSASDIQTIIQGVSKKIHNSCVAQFGPGKSEQSHKKSREEAVKVFFIYRPENKRERVAVKLEFESLKHGSKPGIMKTVLRDLPQVAGMLTSGKLIMTYSSSVVLAETPEEILSDKIRAVYERAYLKGRDIYDIWWLTQKLRVKPSWTSTRAKLEMYQADFSSARDPAFFQHKKNDKEIISALKSDLPRFIPQDIFLVYQENNFEEFRNALKKVTADLLDQGLKKYLNERK
ncbi:hypothetical protein PITCH_A1580054 [uncultured Desulfobacterium sp.]|uniref:Nucleotidyl transferase AbiEii/AbiGii toxin family protein n=1 Tax=uncultured Desulfobacterium sp. TaxID=201089 RepID=A0A445MU16_9BACT|nr:hypothetical protein PITCH_A1580054 [uncultured Desulfobacterium sp.]